MAAPRFIIWVCKGRMCTALGADRVLDAAAEALRGRSDDDRARVIVARGGCYGLCELAPNLVVRRYPADEALPSLDEDRLSLTEAGNETVYAKLQPEDASAVIDAHVDQDAPVEALTRAAREAAQPAKSDVAARIRALRSRNAKGWP